MDYIDLKAMKFCAKHGCLDFERVSPQSFIVDVRLYLNLMRAGKIDDLTATVNYAEVYEDVKKVILGESVNLIECLAERIADTLLTKYEIEKVRVTLHKPQAPVDGEFQDISVTIKREKTSKKRVFFLSLGGNIGEREKTLKNALYSIRSLKGAKIKGLSPIYETKAWGREDLDDFLNMCVKVETTLEPIEFLHEMQKIELSLGRVRKEKWDARTIDIDIVFSPDVEVKTEELMLPHPYFKERAFVLVPLADIASGEIIDGKTISEYLRVCTDNCSVKLYQP